MKVYLIGGPPKCGKTTLAKIMSKRLSIPWISADTLQNIASVYIHEEEHTKSFPHSTARSWKDNDLFYTEYTSDVIVKRYVEQWKITYKAISMMAETYLTDKDDIVLEWYQITPELLNELIKKFGKENIKMIFLTKHDERKFVEDIHKSSTPNDWIIKKTKDESTFLKIAKMISEYSKYFENEAKKYELTVLKMDEDFESQIEKAISLLTKE